VAFYRIYAMYAKDAAWKRQTYIIYLSSAKEKIVLWLS